MNEYIPLILFIIFFVLPLLERALKGGQKPPPPEPRVPPRRGPRGRGEELDAPAPMRGQTLPQESTPAPVAESADPAADMIPDDLWEILTGERRSRPLPHSPPVEHDGAGWDVDAAEDDEVYETEVEVFERERVHLEHREEEARIEAVRTERERAVNTAERAPLREAPLLKVFDASQVPSAAERHAAFHRRVDAAAPLAPAARARTLGPVAGLETAELRRALLLREILGPPKALE